MSNMKLGLVVLAALALQVTAISTPNWSKNSQGNAGLWKECAGDTCIHIPSPLDASVKSNSLYAVRAFSIMAAVLMFLALSCMMYPSMMPSLKKCECMLLCLAGLSSLVAMVIWLAEFLKDKDASGKSVIIPPGYSFYLNAVAGVMALGVCAYMKYY